jgi:tRNA pseudouridine55 synthase
MTKEGIIPVHKPVNFTSHDVVAVIRRILRMKRVGHTGTLDPMVTGVLPLCLGRATRMVEYLQELPKEYEATLKLGLATDTEDLSGQIIEQLDHIECTKSEIEKVLSSFVGPIEQTPPMYSAVKVQGKRLYELARQGKEIERKARTVNIYRINVTHMDLTKSHPEVKFKVLCSKGTYIRTLCVDIGKALGYPALMSDLIRTASGHIRIEQCVSISELEQLQLEDRLNEVIIPMDRAISHIPSFSIDQEYMQRALQGQKIPLSHITPIHLENSLKSAFTGNMDTRDQIRLYSPSRRFLGIFQTDQETQLLKPVKVFEDCR